MEDHRRMVKKACKTDAKYETMVGSYRSIVKAFAKKNKCSQTEAAIELNKVLRKENLKNPKLKSPWLKSLIFAAALDNMEKMDKKDL